MAGLPGPQMLTVEAKTSIVNGCLAQRACGVQQNYVVGRGLPFGRHQAFNLDAAGVLRGEGEARCARKRTKRVEWEGNGGQQAAARPMTAKQHWFTPAHVLILPGPILGSSTVTPPVLVQLLVFMFPNPGQTCMKTPLGSGPVPVFVWSTQIVWIYERSTALVLNGPR